MKIIDIIELCDHPISNNTPIGTHVMVSPEFFKKLHISTTSISTLRENDYYKDRIGIIIKKSRNLCLVEFSDGNKSRLWSPFWLRYANT